MSLKTPADFCPTFCELFDAGDLDGLLALYTDEVVAVPQPGARLVGKEQLRAGLGAFFAMKPYKLNFTPTAIVEGENTALFHGDWTFDGESPDGPVHIDARTSVVLVRQGDSWFVAIDDFFDQG